MMQTDDDIQRPYYVVKAEILIRVPALTKAEALTSASVVLDSLGEVRGLSIPGGHYEIIGGAMKHADPEEP